MVHSVARVGLLAAVLAVVAGGAMMARWLRIHHGPPSQVTGRFELSGPPPLPCCGRVQAEAVRFASPVGPTSYVHRLSLYDPAGVLVDRVMLPGRQPRPLTLDQLRERLIRAGLTGKALAAANARGALGPR